MIGIAEDSAHFVRSGPFHRFLRPADAELVSGGPFPLHVAGVGHASQRQVAAALLRICSTANLRFAGRIPTIHTPIRKITLIGYRDKQATVKRKGGVSREPPAVLVL